MSLKTLIFLSLFAYLQYELWFSESTVQDIWRLQKNIAAAASEIQQLKARNQLLIFDVIDLKTGYDAIEEYARGELGMVKQNETFYLLVE